MKDISLIADFPIFLDSDKGPGSLRAGWTKGDEIVIGKNAGGKEVRVHFVNSLSETKTAEFKYYGNVEASTIDRPGKSEMSIYQADAIDYGNTFDGNGNTRYPKVIFPTGQIMTPESFGNGANLAAASHEITSGESRLYFKNLSGLLKLELKGNAKIKGINKDYKQKRELPNRLVQCTEL